MSRYGQVVSRLDSWNILFFAIICMGPDILTTSEDYNGVRKEGTRLAMPKTICAPDSSSLKPGSGATEGVLDEGVLEQPDYVT